MLFLGLAAPCTCRISTSGKCSSTTRGGIGNAWGGNVPSSTRDDNVGGGGRGGAAATPASWDGRTKGAGEGGRTSPDSPTDACPSHAPLPRDVLDVYLQVLHTIESSTEYKELQREQKSGRRQGRKVSERAGGRRESGKAVDVSLTP